MGADTPRAVTVQSGDSVYTISRRYNVPMKALIEANGLQPPYILYPGQVLKVDPPVVHVVQSGDSLYAISRRYGVDMRALAQKNNIQAPYTIFPGQQLMVPDTYTTATAVARAPAAQPSQQPSNQSARPSIRDVSPAPSAPPPPPARSGSRFVWPVDGELVSKFGPAGKGLHNDGINIAVREGAEVRAVENGVVAYSGNELQGFGNLLLIKHADGWMTAYAHNKELLVKRGDEVRRGQVISRAGQSGNVRSPQLHFELRRGTRAVDPIKYLDSRTS